MASTPPTPPPPPPLPNFDISAADRRKKLRRKNSRNSISSTRIKPKNSPDIISFRRSSSISSGEIPNDELKSPKKGSVHFGDDLPSPLRGHSEEQVNNSESENNEVVDSPRRRLKRRVSSKNIKKNRLRDRRPRLTDNTVRLVASMYENKQGIDPRVFLFDAKDKEECVIYADGNDDEDYNPDFPAIKGATIEKLISGLTPENYVDQDFTFSFLLNYRSFTTAKTICELLGLRWNLPMPQNPSKSGVVIDKDTFDKKIKPIRLRIYNVVKLWIEEHGMDIDEPTRLILKDFIKDYISKDLSSAGSSLQRLIDTPKQGRDSYMFDMKPPTPILPMNLKKSLQFLDLHPEEIARQLTLMDSNLYRSIRPQEFLNSGWTKVDKDLKAPGILAMISAFNHISEWVSTEIVTQTDLKLRAQTMVRFICIAQKCYELNNFNGLMVILASLQNSAVYRLYDTWEILPQKALDMYEFLSKLMNSNAGEGNFHDYRECLKKTVPPLVPYLGLYLTDLTFLNDGNKDFLDEEKRFVNFQKMTKIGRVVRNITTYQQQPYCLSPVEFIQHYIKSFPVLSEEGQYKESIAREKKIPKSQRNQMNKEKSKELKKLKVDFKALHIGD